LVPCDIHPRTFDADRARAFVEAAAPALQALGVDPMDYLRRASPLQYVWRAAKRPRGAFAVRATMLDPVGGVSHVRVVHPTAALATEPGVSARVDMRFETDLPDGIPKIAVLHRPALTSDTWRAALGGLLAAGWVIVVEFDDNPEFFQRMAGDGEATFRAAHAVQTSTPELAEVLRRRNPEVAVFPNAVAELPPIRNFVDTDGVTVFFGALNREQDWRPIIEAVNRVAAAAGPRLRFKVMHDHAFFEALQTPSKEFLPLGDYVTYLGALGGCEISLMPLEDNGFNRAKSDLKFVEAGACRVAPLASRVVYGATARDGDTAMLFSDAAEFETKFRRLVAMPEIAARIAGSARDYVARERMLAYQVAPRLAWYRSLWERRAALTEALRVRMETPFDPRS
jgi:glycosyltransferase involved in cell wall biosynthesis